MYDISFFCIFNSSPILVLLVFRPIFKFINLKLRGFKIKTVILISVILFLILEYYLIFLIGPGSVVILSLSFYVSNCINHSIEMCLIMILLYHFWVSVYFFLLDFWLFDCNSWHPWWFLYMKSWEGLYTLYFSKNDLTFFLADN